jgi:hydroxymethylbilane synthase
MIIGTRGSDLALWQARTVQAAIGGELRIISTQGDRSLAERLVGTLEKGFFTEELEAALRAGEIDCAVHSLKDVPTRLSPDFMLGAILPRATPGDILITHPEHVNPGAFPLRDGVTVGASSLRRDALLKHFAPGVRPQPLRGNVPTRVQKLRDHKMDAIVVAAAGVERLQLDLHGLAAFSLNPTRWQPAPGQGAVAVECRAADRALRAELARISDGATIRAVAWERAFLRTLEGGCATPFGCYVSGDDAWLGQLQGSMWHTHRVTLPKDMSEEFIAASLAALPKGHDHDDWLFRPL